MSCIGQSAVRTLLAVGVLFIFSSIARAQQDQSTQSDSTQQPVPDQPKPAPQDSGNPSPDTTPAPVGAPMPIDTTIKAAGSSLPWAGSGSLLKWGPFSVASLDYTYIKDQLAVNSGQPPADLGLNIFSADLAFEWLFKRNRFLFQYTPNLAIVNGDVSTSAGLDNSFGFATAIQLNPRLTMTLKDDFSQVRSRSLFPDNYLLSDALSGSSVQSNFLENSGSFLQNTVSVAFDYKWSQRTSITVQPAYRYLRTSSDNLNYRANQQDVATTVAVTYALSPTRNIGVLDSIQYLRTTDPLPMETVYNTTNLFYSQQLSASWFIQGQLGVQMSLENGAQGNYSRLSAGGTIIKQFQHSSISLAYLRGRGMTTSYITNNSEDRVDANYRVEVTRRLGANAGLGYYRESGSEPHTQAKYAIGELRYLLLPAVYLSAEYSRRFQSSPNIQLVSGNRNTYVFGVHWQPSPLSRH